MARIKDDRVPTTPDEREKYFVSQMEKGEQLCTQGPEFAVEAALAFFRALRVYPSPVELIMISQNTVPEPVFKIAQPVLENPNIAPTGMSGQDAQCLLGTISHGCIMARSGEPSRSIRLWETSPHWAISHRYTFMLFSSPLLSLIADRLRGLFSTTRLPLALGNLERAQPLRTAMDASPKISTYVGMLSGCYWLPRRPIGNLHFARFPDPASWPTRWQALSRWRQSKIRLFPKCLPHGSHVAPIPTLPLPSPSTDGLSTRSVAQRRRRARERATTTHSSITLEPVIRRPANRVEHDAAEARLEPPTNPTIARHKENDVLIRVHPQRRCRATERGTTTLNSTTVLPVASSPAEHNVDQSRMEIATNPTVTTHHENDRNSSFLSPTTSDDREPAAAPTRSCLGFSIPHEYIYITSPSAGPSRFQFDFGGPTLHIPASGPPALSPPSSPNFEELRKHACRD
ncbi:hypothetical protein BC826DRAFT_1100975 [Russula brevipes]|nr:hypothetical protein BC826DRAFT_1100975 [Russula brevipes]